MGFDAVFELVVDGTDGQVAFEFFECLFEFGELEVVFPKFSRVAPAQIGAQQIASFASQTTDAHLLALAKTNGADLATLDTGIPGAFLLPPK